MKAYMQRMGRSLMLPVAVLPAASILVGIANWIVGMGVTNVATTFLMNSGLAILDNLALLFSVGLALGMSKDKDGAAALAGLVAYLVPKAVLRKEVNDAFDRLEKRFNPVVMEGAGSVSEINSGMTA